MYLVINLMAKKEIIEFLYVSFTTKKVALFSVILQRLTKNLHHFLQVIIATEWHKTTVLHFSVITSNHMFYMLPEYFNKLVGVIILS